MIPTSTWMSSTTKTTMLGRSSPTKTLLTKGSIVVALVGTALMTIGGNHLLKQHPICDFNPSKPSHTEFMNAVSYKQHGNTSMLLYTENEYPRPIPRDDQILIKIKASSINPCDFKFRRINSIPSVLQQMIFPKPKIPGIDVAGIVTQVGKDVTKFQIGDNVVGLLPSIGLRWGGAAEYTTISESLAAEFDIPQAKSSSDSSSDSSATSTDEEATTTQPSTTKLISFEEAASIPVVALTTIQGFENVPYLKRIMYGEDVKPEQGQKPKKVLIHAGAGGVGTFAIQYAKNVLGLYVATTASKSKSELLKQLGADEIIDYHTTNFEDVIQDYDIVFDTMSWLYEDRTLNKDSKVLKKDGGYYINIFSSDWSLSKSGKEIVNGLTTFKNMITSNKLLRLLNRRNNIHYVTVAVQPNSKHLQMALDAMKQNKVTAIIDKKFQLQDTAKAYDYLEQGHATGKVIITI